MPYHEVERQPTQETLSARARIAGNKTLSRPGEKETWTRPKYKAELAKSKPVKIEVIAASQLEYFVQYYRDPRRPIALVDHMTNFR